MEKAMADEPRTHRSNLVPAGAIGVPKAVIEADARLRAAATAADEATSSRIEADKADRAAAEFDSRAAVSAVEAGKKTPQPTAAAKKAEFQRAIQQEAAAKKVAHRALIALGRTIIENRDEWREGQEPVVREQADRIIAAIDDVERELSVLGQGLGILNGLRRELDIDHGIAFKAATVGSRERRPVDKQLEELRDTIRAALPVPPRTPAEQQREQELRDRRLRWQRMARGGIHVPNM